MTDTPSISTNKRHTAHAVLLVAHGERGGRLNNARLVEIADQVRALLSNGPLGPVAVEAGVLKGDPSLQTAWTALSGTQKWLYPFFMSDGYFCTNILPRKVQDAIGDKALDLTPLAPFGVSHQLAGHIRQAISRELVDLGRAGEKAPVLIAAHGASIDRQSCRRANELAQALSRTGLFGPVSCAFLDEAPHLEDVVGQLDPNTLILPLFNGLGSHSIDDMAELAAMSPDGVHFVAPVGAQSWVAQVVAQDIEAILVAKCPGKRFCVAAE